MRILLFTFTLSASIGAIASNPEDAKRCAETVGAAESPTHALFQDLQPKTAGEFIELYHPERIPRFKMPFYLGLFARDHSQVGREYFHAILPHLPHFFALKPTVEEVIRLFDVTSSFELGSLSKDKSTWLYTKAFLKAMAALSSDYFENLYNYKSALAEVSVEARESRDPKIMDLKDEMVLKRPTWTYQNILEELNIQSVEVPASALAKEPDLVNEADSEPDPISEPDPSASIRQAPASPRYVPPKPTAREKSVPQAPVPPSQSAAAPSASKLHPGKAPLEPQESKPSLIGTTNTGTTFYILKTLFNLWRDSKK